MVFDFGHAGRAGAAQRILTQVGIGAIYTPDVPVLAEEGSSAEFHIIYRVQVSEGDAERATDLLTQRGLLEQLTG